MRGAYRKVLKSENLSNAKFGVRNALALLLRYWLCYRISWDAGYLDKACHSAEALLEINASSIDLYLAAIFIYAEREDLPAASRLLAVLHPYRNFYKNNRPLLYAWLQYLVGLVFARGGKLKQARKVAAGLEDVAPASPIAAMVTGALRQIGRAHV
jgi:hypothetical protein